MYVDIKIPSVEEYANGFPQYWMKRVFINSISINFQINALTTTYVRLVEVALMEYRLGQIKLNEFWANHSSLGLGSMHRGIAHFENCISSMHRAIECYKRLRNHSELAKLSAVLNSPKPSFIKARISDQLRNIRNEIHHLEAHVMGGIIQEGQPIALMCTGSETIHPTEINQTIKTIDRLAIGQYELFFSDIATWLIEMGGYAEKISLYEPNQEALS